MRALCIICLAVLFLSIVAIPYNDKNHQIKNSKAVQDVKTDKKKFLRRLGDLPFDLPYLNYPESANETNVKIPLCTEKTRECHHVQKRYRRNDHTKSNAESSTLTEEKNNKENKFVSKSASAEKIELHDGSFADLDVVLRTRPGRSGNTNAYDRKTESYPPNEEHRGLNKLLTRLFEALQNDSAKNDIRNRSNFIGHEEDRCQKWLDNREKIEKPFPGSINELPACPCLYPNDIVYEDMIYDKNRRRKYRWRDATNDPQRPVYKRGAFFCIRSLPTRGTESIGAQHCCYDEERRLLTRGSGAGTPYIVSPDASDMLHDKFDLLPWRLCKGDFTRYNKARVPNNDNECDVNPDDEEYEYQVESAKNY